MQVCGNAESVCRGRRRVSGRAPGLLDDCKRLWTGVDGHRRYARKLLTVNQIGLCGNPERRRSGTPVSCRCRAKHMVEEEHKVITSVGKRATQEWNPAVGIPSCGEPAASWGELRQLGHLRLLTQFVDR